MNTKQSILAAAALLALFAPMSAQADIYSDIFVFGDSFSDTGNLSAKTFGFVPSDPYYDGRYSDGLLWVEYLADRLDLTVTANGRNPQTLVGNNFAVAGAEADQNISIFPFGSIPSVSNQVSTFLSVSPPVDSDALYVLYGGNNDVRAAADPEEGYSPAQQTQIIQDAVAAIAGAVNALAGDGARTILVPNVGDLGFTPEAGPTEKNNAALSTSLTIQFNDLLATTLDGLTLPTGSELLQFDAFALTHMVVDDALNNAGAVYGITNIDTPIFPGFAGSPGADPAVSLFSDDLHLSTVGHAIFADSVTLSSHVWDVDASGDWSLGNNWNHGVAPGGVGVPVAFADAITTPRTVTNDAAVTVGSIRFDNASSYTIDGTGSLAIEVTFGSTSIEVQGGSHALNLDTTFVSPTDIDTTGGALTFGGTVTLNANVTINGGIGDLVIETGGRLTGGSTILGNLLVNSGGTVAPGTSPGIMTVTGNSTHAAGSTLEIEVGGTTAGVDYDQLSVAGSVLLGGDLIISQPVPPPATSAHLYSVVLANSDDLGGETVSGTFDTVSLPGDDGLGRRFSVLYENRAADGVGTFDTVKIGLARPGDANFDNVVDAVDLIAASPFFGTTTPTNWRGGNWRDTGSSTGIVDAVDLIDASPFFAQSYGSGSQPLGGDATTPGQGSDGTPSIIYDFTTGEILIDTDGNITSSYVLDSLAGIFTGLPPTFIGGTFFTTDNDFRIAENFHTSLTGVHDLGAVAQPFLNQAFLLNDLTLLGGATGQANFDFDLVLRNTPEPSTLVLLGLGLAALVIFVRRRAV